MEHIRKKVEFRHEHGLHLRPAAEIARIAGKFNADVVLCKDSDQAHAASVFSLLLLGVAKGESIEIVASGVQAAEAVAAMHAYIESINHRNTTTGSDLSTFAA